MFRHNVNNFHLLMPLDTMVCHKP